MEDRRRLGIVFLLLAWLMAFCLCLAVIVSAERIQACGDFGSDLCLVEPGFEVFFVGFSIVAALGLGLAYTAPWQRLRSGSVPKPDDQ